MAEGNWQNGGGRDVEGGKRNHETVCNMLSMLTLGVDDKPSPSPPPPPSSFGSERPSSSSRRHQQGSSSEKERMVLLNLANTPESCLTLRRAGCIPLLVELIYPPQRVEGVASPEVIQIRAAKALKNIVQFNPDEGEKKKELRVLRLLEGIRLFSEAVKENKQEVNSHPTPSVGSLTKLSFDEQHKRTMCLLGAIHALADLIVSDHAIHGNDPPNLKEDCLVIRRLSGVALTNLTINDKTNKALLCGMKEFLLCLVAQLNCENEEICQISASVLRNISFKADSASKTSLSEVSVCSKLMLAAMKAHKESTLKAALGALWNLSAQCRKNMSDICNASDESLKFLISLMRPDNPILNQMKTPLTIIEHASSILRNISPHLHTSPELRRILRENDGYRILLEHLKSSSMLVVGNACGSLCSLSGGAESEEDQRKLLDLNAIPMLKSLVYSKDERISQGSSTALRNLLSSKFAKEKSLQLDSRLSAYIYTPSNNTNGGEKSQNSQQEFMQQPQPPAAHQQVRECYTHKPPMSLFNYPGSRPSNIGYLGEEPLDLTVSSSAKSSPIHVVSAAEFSSRPRPASSASGVIYPQSTTQHYKHYYNNAPNSIQQHHNTQQHHKFNQSCPEILSRFQQHQTQQYLQDSNKPLDYSSNPTSNNSSLRGGEMSANENYLVAVGTSTGDTPFNYSLRFGEEEAETEITPAAKSDDTVKTYCYEGTPQNFSISNSCNDLVQELEYEEKSNKLHSIDEVKPYYVENTPAAFSRASSLSSIHSVEEESLEKAPEHMQQQQQQQGNLPEGEDQQDNNASGKTELIPPQPIPRKRTSLPASRVTFSADETPLMFSRCSSVASLDSLVGGKDGRNNEDDLSDYSRRESEVVSPSDLPDSPRALVPPIQLFQQQQELPTKRPRSIKKPMEEDAVQVYSATMEEKSGFNSCRSLSPLTVDGEELAVLGKGKLATIEQPNSVTPALTTDGIIAKKSEADELKVFAMEGTPFYGVSTATSLSDLIGELEEETTTTTTTTTKTTVHASSSSSSAPQPQLPKDKEEEDQQKEPIYSDSQLLEKCISVGKAMGLPKSQSEFKIIEKQPTNVGTEGEKKKLMGTSKSQDFEFDDPDLAALIQIGRNRTKDKEKKKSSSSSRKSDKDKSKHTSTTASKPTTTSIIETKPVLVASVVVVEEKTLEKSGSLEEESSKIELNQISTMSLGSEWNDETPTFSSPIPSMSISTAMRLVGDEVSMSAASNKGPNQTADPMAMSAMSAVLLENIEPPSTFSNLVSSSDCVVQAQGPHPNSDKLSRKWKALQQEANSNCSVSNLLQQKPPLDFDMENSMISVASIKSEIYELSASEHEAELFQSALEEVENTETKERDNSIGGNTYTIFPPENANRLSGVKISGDLSDGGNTVISEDFTDAEDIEEYETAPLADLEKSDSEKAIGGKKPLMQVHPLKYNTFVVNKKPVSPKCSPKQKRKDDPDRYKTHTINPIKFSSPSDANGNPTELRFATFRVAAGPKINNMNNETEASAASPSSSPGGSPKGIRGRRKPLYSSLPPSAIIRNKQQQQKSGVNPPPPVPPKPKPSRTVSPARSTGSIGGVYVRPTRTTELRIAANNSRETSPRRVQGDNTSKTSSNSSLNNGSTVSVPQLPSRPKVAPRPPIRTTPQIKGSNSTFGMNTNTMAETEMDNGATKGYSTLPKSSKLSGSSPFSLERYSASSRESIPESERSGKGGMGKISNLWKKMDFRNHKGNGGVVVVEGEKPEKGKKSSKLSNFFGRGKKQEQKVISTEHQPPPFRVPRPIHEDCGPAASDNNLLSTSGTCSTGPTIQIVRRNGENNKVLVSPFNYTPPLPQTQPPQQEQEGNKGQKVPSQNNEARNTTKITTV